MSQAFRLQLPGVPTSRLQGVLITFSFAGLETVLSWVECLPCVHKDMGSIPNVVQTGMLVHAHNPSTAEVEARRVRNSRSSSAMEWLANLGS